MDWFQYARSDWEVYHDPNRIKVFVQKGKITTNQYQDITGEPYSI
jgi:uncharacterized XkdX family phage protein